MQHRSILIFLLMAGAAYGNQRFTYSCQQGGKTVVTGGVSGAPKVQGSYPQCLVTVYITNTLTPATLFSDNSGTAKANPFTANTDGSFFFYAANGRYDVTMSGGGLPAPVTVGDILLADPASGAPGVTSFNSRTGAVVPVTSDYTWSMIAGSKQGNTNVPQMAGTNSGVNGAGLCNDASGNATTSGCTNPSVLPTPTSQLQYLRTTPNAGNNTTLQFSTLPIVNVQDYNWSAQTCNSSNICSVGGSNGASISIGNNTVTLTPGPKGLSYNDSRVRLWLTGGTGTAESVPLLTAGPGTCDGTGQTSCTITFTAAHTHTGAFTVQSSLVGIYEALVANPGHTIRIPAARYTMRDCLNLPPGTTTTLQGDGIDPLRVTGTILDFSNVTTCHAISMQPVTPDAQNVTLREFGMVGPNTGTGTGDGIYILSATDVLIDHVLVEYFSGHGIEFDHCVTPQIVNHTVAAWNGRAGLYMHGDANIAVVSDSEFSGNARYDGWANIYITADAGHENAVIDLSNNDIDSAGNFTPFGGAVTTAYGIFVQNTYSITLRNNYFEANLAYNVSYYSGVHGIIEAGNWFNQTGVTVISQILGADITNYKSSQNTFYGPGNARTFNSTDLSTYDIGYDTCLATSTECATHPRLLGTATSLSLTGTVTAAKTINYIASEAGGSGNNALVVVLLDQSGAAVPLAAGLQITIKLSHTLQAGANTITFNGTSKNLKSTRNVANNIAVAYANTGTISVHYDGTQFVDVSQ